MRPIYRPFPTLALLTVATALSSLAPAQTAPCANRVANGDFEQIVVSPWLLSGGANATYPTFPVVGALPSRCVRLVPTSGNYALTQTTPLTLTAGDVVEVAADFESNFNFAVDFGFTPAGGGMRQSLGNANVSIGSQRVALRHVPNATATGTLDLTFMSGVAGGIAFHVDNVTVRRNDLQLNFLGPRRSSAVTWELLASPGRTYGLFVAGGLAPTPFPLGGCTGFVWLDATVEPFAVGSVGMSGRATGQVLIPTRIRGVRLDLQAVAFPPCQLGCPLTTAF